MLALLSPVHTYYRGLFRQSPYYVHAPARIKRSIFLAKVLKERKNGDFYRI